VGGGGPITFEDARGLDEMIRVALRTAFRRGFSGVEIRTAVERWLAASPPDRVVVIDPSKEMGELLTHEIRQSLQVPVSCCLPEDLARDPGMVSGALTVSLPYHVDTIRRLAPGASVEIVNLETSDEARDAVLSLPQGAIVLVVSHSPTVLPFASVLFRSLRGDEILVETRALSENREWRRIASAADVVFVDVLSLEPVRRARPRKIREFRTISESAIKHLRDALTVVIPKDVKVKRRS